MPSKALLVSFSAAEEAVVAGTRRRSGCRDRLRRMKICENSVFSDVLAINLPLQPILDKKVSGGPLPELGRNAPFWHTCVTWMRPSLARQPFHFRFARETRCVRLVICNAPDSDSEYPRIPTIAFRRHM